METNDKIIRRSVPLASADFDSIKDSLKEFLKERPELSDYDFDGAVSNLLLDELSLNTHINAFYLNMVGNEAFLKTAVRRDSVVARAEALNYFPRTIRSAIAQAFIELFPVGTPSYIDVEKYTAFTASTTGLSFNFYNSDAFRVSRDATGRYTFDGMNLVEGKFLTHRFTVDANIIERGIIIPNVNVDSSHIKVSIAENAISTNYIDYELSDNIVNLNDSSEIYFIRETEGFLNIYFGDGIIGKRPIIGSVIRVIYPISSGPAANGAVNFALASAIPGVTSASVTTTSPAFGGDAAETIDSIKINAPRFAETQNRSVTAFDYESILRKYYQNIDGVAVWGGEDNNPPRYGRVILAIKPSSGYYMTRTEKSKVEAILKKYNVIAVKPIIVDPEYIFVRVSTTVDYSSFSSDKTSGQIENIVANRVLTYSDTFLSRFDKSLRKSVLSRLIDYSDPSIISNVSFLTMEKRVFPVINKKAQINVDFSNELKENSVTSSNFTFNGAAGCYFKSVENKIGIYRNSGTNILTVDADVGVIDYDTGIISIDSIEIDDIPQVDSQKDEISGQYYITFSATPRQDDIDAGQRQIVQIISCDVTAEEVDKSDI